VIFIVSSSSREAELLATLCEQRSWPCQGCTTVSEFNKLAEKTNPRVVVARLRLQDGYSDDILASLKLLPVFPLPHVIVLAPADCSTRQEARQVALGADCVMRDPVRTEVMLEYLGKYRIKPTGTATTAEVSPLCYEFAGVQVFPHEHRLVRLKQSIHVAPQEMEFLRVLAHSVGKVVPYPVLYTELFNQRFAGDTANCRVLLGKVTTSFRQLGVDLRSFIEVIPKSGYLYSIDALPVRSRRPKARPRPAKAKDPRTIRRF
jgi:DNA-binding response OmpR family regulator